MSDRALPVVFVVDDDSSVLRAISRLLTSAGLVVRAFPSAQAFLALNDASVPGCVVLDVTMPGIGGLELQQILETAGQSRPVIFITGHGDIPMSVRAMKAGAVDFLTKPFRDDELLAAIQLAFDRDCQARLVHASSSVAHQRLSTLTPREREVMDHVIAGELNKQIAGHLGTVEKTIKVHRGRMMQKMGIRSVAELVRIAGMTRPKP